MHYRTVSILAAAGAALASASAQAQAQADRTPAAVPPLPRTEVTQKLDAEFKSLDTNGDGKLTKAEVQAAIQKRAAEIEATLQQQQKQEFDKLDTNKDGRLSLAEYQAGTSIKPKDNAADVRMGQLDANKDGSITAAEFRAVTLSQFDKLDTNKDGVLSPQERPAAPAR
jgi:Ca2+-binding EF-hand superfamily protein